MDVPWGIIKPALETLPVPSSGRAITTETGAKTFRLQFEGLTREDRKKLEGFYKGMGGPFLDFQILPSGQVRRCHFANDNAGKFTIHSDGSNSALLEIELI